MSSHGYSHHPGLLSLRRIIGRIVESDRHPINLDSERPVENELNTFKGDLESFAKSNEPALLVNELLRMFDADLLRLPARGNALILAESKNFIFTIASLNGNGAMGSTILDDVASEMISSHPSSSLLANIGYEDLHLSLHEIPREWIDGVISPGNLSAGVETAVILHPGKALYLDARRHIPDIKYQDKPVLVARILSRRYQSLACSIDRETRQFRMFSSSIPAIARIPLAMKFVRALIVADESLVAPAAVEESLAIMEQYCSHQLYFFRWTAIQSMAAIDLPRARKYIISAMDDPHPQVRRAATAAANVLELEA
jgi:hypothetical protein